MQAFGQQLNAAEIAAVVTYTRNAWGNNMQDSVQPKEINVMMASSRRANMNAVVEEHHDDHHDHGPAKGITRWLLHDKPQRYRDLISVVQFCYVFRGQYMCPWDSSRIVSARPSDSSTELFNQLTTMHGLIMVFGAVMPAFVGLANWLVPMMIGAPDMALPRMNNYSFWILPFAFGMLLSTFFMEGGAPNYGWTFYAPLSTEYAPPSVTFFIFRSPFDGNFINNGLNQRNRNYS